MAKKIADQWELYSHAEFTLRKSILKESIALYQTNNVAVFNQVTSKTVNIVAVIIF